MSSRDPKDENCFNFGDRNPGRSDTLMLLDFGRDENSTLANDLDLSLEKFHLEARQVSDLSSLIGPTFSQLELFFKGIESKFEESEDTELQKAGSMEKLKEKEVLSSIDKDFHQIWLSYQNPSHADFLYQLKAKSDLKLLANQIYNFLLKVASSGIKKEQLIEQFVEKILPAENTPSEVYAFRRRIAVAIKVLIGMSLIKISPQRIIQYSGRGDKHAEFLKFSSELTAEIYSRKKRINQKSVYLNTLISKKEILMRLIDRNKAAEQTIVKKLRLVDSQPVLLSSILQESTQLDEVSEKQKSHNKKAVIHLWFWVLPLFSNPSLVLENEGNNLRLKSPKAITIHDYSCLLNQIIGQRT